MSKFTDDEDVNFDNGRQAVVKDRGLHDNQGITPPHLRNLGNLPNQDTEPSNYEQDRRNAKATAHNMQQSRPIKRRLSTDSIADIGVDDIPVLETTEDEITWCLTCEQILNNDGDCWCKPKNELRAAQRQRLESRLG